MISLYCWNPGQSAGMWLSDEVLRTKCEQLRSSSDIYWIDLENPTPEEENLAFKVFHSVYMLTLDDVTYMRRHPGQPHFPKVEEFPDYLFVIVNPLTQALTDRLQAEPEQPIFPDATSFTQLSAVLTRRWLITHHYEPLLSVEFLKSFLSRHESRAERGPDYLFHLILDSAVNQYRPVIELFDKLLEKYEDEVFANNDRDILPQMLNIKRVIGLFRKTLVAEREILAQLTHGDFELIDEREAIYYRNVYDHILRFTEMMDGVRETVGDLMNMQLSATSHRLNEVMKILTMMSTVGMVCTVIGGIYGMNFDHEEGAHPLNMPELRWAYGYPFALSLMAVGVIAVLAFFRWKKWL